MNEMVAAAFGKPQSVISEEALAEKIASKNGDSVELSSRDRSFGESCRKERLLILSLLVGQVILPFINISQCR